MIRRCEYFFFLFHSQPSEVPVLLDLLLDAFESQKESTVRVAILSLLPKLCSAEKCAHFASVSRPQFGIHHRL
jgi:hypothetical protein